MHDLPDVRAVAHDVSALLGRVRTIQPGIADSTLRHFVGRLSGRLRDVQHEMAAKLPPHVAATRAKILDARHQAESIKSRLPQLRAEAEEAERTHPAAPAVAAPAPVDPALASSLRDEILQRYGPPQATSRGVPGGNPNRPGWGH
ncbi:hypothetical protein TA3x_003324 [Tundrisphaera sp. TA3]|uniref:hypothetical protein n=1 Tax=Tundrisphaera sp. TA3 TaxID=3435775 RepID=UPI003EB77CF4